MTRESPLPVEAANGLLAGFKGRLHSVKTQELKLEDGTSILIARVKVPTPKGVSGHLIRRFDTEAISASSLFRVAFPQASEDAERDEMAYLAQRYNTRRAGDEDEAGNGKLTGVWVPVEDAPTLIKEYELTRFAAELLAFEAPSTMPAGEAISTPTAPTPRRRASKSPGPPTSARSKRSRVMSPPASAATSIATRSQTSTMQSLASTATTPSKPISTGKGRKSTATTPAAAEKAPVAVPVTEQDQVPKHDVGGIQVTQEIATDNLTGETIEETKVTFTGADAEAITGGADAGLIGTDEQAREAAENARKLIESLKEEGILQSGATNNDKRARALEEDEEDEMLDAAEAAADDGSENAKPGVVKRWFGSNKDRRPKKAKAELGELQVMQSPDGAQVLVAQAAPPQQPANRRKYIGMVGMVVVGAATAAAPYFLS